MGNRFALSKHGKEFFANSSATGNNRVVRVVKNDSKILEYGASILVKDVLLDFPGHGIFASGDASKLLSPSFELKVGKTYYLLPCSVTVQSGTSADVSGSEQAGAASKRIKVVLTKQQLRDLLSKQLSVEELISGLEKQTWDCVDSSTSWRPKLETIPEGSD